MKDSDRLGGLYEETGLFTGPSATWHTEMNISELTGDRCESPAVVFLMWHSFGKAIGFDKLRAAYGDYWPRNPLPGEVVHIFSYRGSAPGVPCGDIIGWSSARKDEVDPYARLALGIWPQHDSQGWATKIRDWTFEYATHRWPMIRGCAIEILHSNKDYLDKRRARAQQGSPWRAGGYVDHRAAQYTIFFRDS